MTQPSIDVRLVDAAVDTEPLERLLVAEELARARRFRFEADRRRSIVTRAALRTLLAERLALASRDVPIVIGDNDKPRLATGALHFNATHSGDLVAIAIASSDVGVDAEELRPMSDFHALARRFFSPAEVERVESASDVAGAFFTIWTMKEAVVKAIGSGITAPLQHFTTPARTAALTAIESSSATFRGWHVQQLEAPDGYRAAVATREQNARVTVRTFRF